ncbi:MAG: transporter substrate-binding domain-containing protein [Pseudomonadota bacterium]
MPAPVRASARILWLLLALAAAAAPAPAAASPDLLGPPQRQWLANHGPLKIGVFSDYPPYGFLDAKAQPAGISIDLWRLVARKLDLKLSFTPARFADQLAGLKNGRFDSLAGCFPLAERQAFAQFSEPFLTIGAYIWTAPALAKSVQGLNDLKGRSVGAVAGDSGQVLAQKAGLTVTAFADYPQAVKALAAGDVQAIVMDELVVEHVAKEAGLTGRLARAGAAVDQGRMTWPVAKGNAMLLEILNLGLKAVSPAELKAITDQWLK